MRRDQWEGLGGLLKAPLWERVKFSFVLAGVWTGTGLAGCRAQLYVFIFNPDLINKLSS